MGMKVTYRGECRATVHLMIMTTTICRPFNRQGTLAGKIVPSKISAHIETPMAYLEKMNK